MTNPDVNSATSLTILVPVFNDWDAAALLIPEIDRALASADMTANVLLIDDGSTEFPNRVANEYNALSSVEVLSLARNMGHQRAIAIGLAYVAQNRPHHDVVVIDGDGEDDPKDIVRLVAQMKRAGHKKAIFAERTRRAETFGFRVFYQIYRALHRALTGRGIRFGNFSALPRTYVARIVTAPELWNHYAASLVKTRIPFDTIPSARRKRLSGQSRMNFVSLVTHGLAAISVYSETVGTRLIIGTGTMVAACITAIVSIVSVRLFTDSAIPGWATYLVSFMLVLIVQAATAAFMVSFFTLAARSAVSVLPVNGHAIFVRGVYPLSDYTDPSCL